MQSLLGLSGPHAEHLSPTEEGLIYPKNATFIPVECSLNSMEGDAPLVRVGCHWQPKTAVPTTTANQGFSLIGKCEGPLVAVAGLPTPKVTVYCEKCGMKFHGEGFHGHNTDDYNGAWDRWLASIAVEPGQAPFQVNYVTIFNGEKAWNKPGYYHPVLPIIQGTPSVVLVLMWSPPALQFAYQALINYHRRLVEITREMSHAVSRLRGYR